MFIIENPVLNRYRMASVNQENYLIVAAIDFGTTYLGYAFSTRHDFLTNPTNAYVKEWVDPGSATMHNKTSTCILFTKEKKFSNFGFEAEAKYLELTNDKALDSWYLFRRFKMSLYNVQVNDTYLYSHDLLGCNYSTVKQFYTCT